MWSKSSSRHILGSLELIPGDGYWLLDLYMGESAHCSVCEWGGKGREERVKRWFLKQAECESLSLVARRLGSCLDPAALDLRNTHTSRLVCPVLPFWAQILLLLWAPSHTENVLRSSSSSSLTPLEEDNCSWHICGWAPTLDKDYRRYKSWTMAPLLTQN